MKSLLNVGWAVPSLRRDLIRIGESTSPVARVQPKCDAAVETGSTVDEAFLDYFRCPTYAAVAHADTPGYFTCDSTLDYGRRFDGLAVADVVGSALELTAPSATDADAPLRIPFDLSEAVTYLRRERYPVTASGVVDRIGRAAASRRIYYQLRPLLSVGVRKHIQKLWFGNWQQIAFPHWPVDFSVDKLMQKAMALVLQRRGIERLPFIWFWPDGAQSCVMMTHDVERGATHHSCEELMDLDDSYGIRSAFQVIPEAPGNIELLAQRIRRRGFEVNLHDLNHDGSLFRDREQFVARAARINEYARALECRGFRSGAMYRRQDWFDAFEFSYDMSVPNTAHLEPQRGGCCTVMPYFVGNILELPLTTIQDYSLFHILGDYSTTLWKQQIELILAEHGLISFIAHPNYLAERRARKVYQGLLSYLCEIRNEKGMWVVPPGDIDHWWRSRQSMSLVQEGDSWTVQGPDSERARVAYATLQNGRVTYQLEDAVDSQT